ncbi:MAG: VOC family protein, partial [Bellilinea sp.]
MPKITPSLWFNDNAEEAINFYTSVFKNAKVLSVSRYTDAGPLPAGTFLTGVFQLEGQEFMAINGGPYFTFNPAIS